MWNTNMSQIEDDSLYEHFHLRHRDPLEYFERVIFTSLNQMTPVLLIFTLPWVKQASDQLVLWRLWSLGWSTP